MFPELPAPLKGDLIPVVQKLERMAEADVDGPIRAILRTPARAALAHCREVETDLLVFAADHWNFNVRGFNPGGNRAFRQLIGLHHTGAVLVFLS